MSEPIELPDGLPDEAYDLGDPIDEFSLTSARTAGKMAVAVVMILIGVAGLGLTVFLFIAMIDAPGPGHAGGGRGLVFLAVFSVALIVAGISIPIRLAKHQGLRVFACPDGLVRVADDAEVVRWDDVEVLRQEVKQAGYDYRGIYPLFKVRRLSDGREFVFDNFLPRVRDLGRLIEKKTLAYLLPPEQEALDDDEALKYGPLTLSRRGIRCGDKLLRWDEVKGVMLDKSAWQIVISKEGKWTAWHKQPVANVPNYHVFLALVHDELEDRRGR